MSQYLAERPFPLTDRPYFQRVQHIHNHWPHYYPDPSPHQPTSYHPDNNIWQHNTSSPSAIEHFPHTTHTNPLPSLTDYPESSQRTILTSSPDINNTALHPLYSYKNDHRRSHSSHSSDYGHSTLWDTNPPAVDQYPDLDMHPEDTEPALVDASQSSESRQTSPPASVLVASSFHPSVKVEPEDPEGCFIMELSSLSPSFGLSVSEMNQALAPPTEVPLRATQASKDMRKMMGVFRLNPFAMHSGEGRGVMPAPWCGGGPLEEEPLIFEFQLDIEDDSRDRQANHPSESSPTDSLDIEEEAQLRSFSPSFELHPEDTRSEMGEEHELEPEDCRDQDQQNEWSDADYCNRSEMGTSSTTHSVHTPSESRSAHTPFNESSVYQYPTPPPPAASTWDIDYQPHGEDHLPPAESMEGGHKMHRLHSTTSHPYLRRNYPVSPSSSTHSLPQSQPHLQTLPQLNYGYPVLQQPTHHEHQSHYSHNQAPSESYSQPTFPDSMISAPVELIPATSHRLEDSILSSSYMRSGRALKLADDQTSISHHHPAGIVNGYTPREPTSSVYTSQHDTHPSGHQYEMIQHSSLGPVYSPSRRWSLPETIGSTM